MKTKSSLKSFCSLLLAGLVLGSLGASSSSSTPKAKTDVFFQTLTRSGSDKAFESLFEGSLFAQSKSEDLARMKEDFNKHLTGTAIAGFEKVKEQNYGQSVVKLVYILKLDSHPLVLEFHFYKARSDWTLARVGFDEDLRKLD